MSATPDKAVIAHMLGEEIEGIHLRAAYQAALVKVLETCYNYREEKNLNHFFDEDLRNSQTVTTK